MLTTIAQPVRVALRDVLPPGVQATGRLEDKLQQVLDMQQNCMLEIKSLGERLAIAEQGLVGGSKKSERKQTNSRAWMNHDDVKNLNGPDTSPPLYVLTGVYIRNTS